MRIIFTYLGSKLVLRKIRVYVVGFWVIYAPRTWAILTEIFHGFSQSLQANAGIVPGHTLPSTSIPIHYSLIIAPFGTI
jgi:hypothetical protein